MSKAVVPLSILNALQCPSLARSLPFQCMLPPRRIGRPRGVDLREVVNAILYLASTGCQWRMLPKDFPPVSTVQRYFYDWRDGGLWREISNMLVMRARELAGRWTRTCRAAQCRGVTERCPQHRCDLRVARGGDRCQRSRPHRQSGPHGDRDAPGRSGRARRRGRAARREPRARGHSRRQCAEVVGGPQLPGSRRRGGCGALWQDPSARWPDRIFAAPRRRGRAR